MSNTSKNNDANNNLQDEDLDEVSGGATRSAINIGSFGTVSSGAIKSKIKVGGVGNWDEGESELTAG